MPDWSREVREALAPLRDSVEAALRKAIDRREDFDATVDRLTLAAAGHIGPEVGREERLAPVVQLRPVRLEPDEPCPGCGALPQKGRHGFSRLHAADCTRITSRV